MKGAHGADGSSEDPNDRDKIEGPKGTSTVDFPEAYVHAYDPNGPHDPTCYLFSQNGPNSRGCGGSS